MTNKDKMHDTELYISGDQDILKEQRLWLEKQYDFNHTRPGELLKRDTLLKDMFLSIGNNCYIEPPLHANWGGKHVSLGNSVYINFNLTLVDDTYITIGDHTMIGPNVVIATAAHPINPELRAKGYQFNAPVKIGKNCWLGAGVIILPGVTIGDNVVIGAGSVVTKDIKPNVVVVGNPAKVLREVYEHDNVYYFKDKKIIK